MNLYMVDRTGFINYDEFDAMIFRAEDEKDALAQALQQEDFISTWQGPFVAWDVEITLLGTSVKDIPGYVLGSFNAG